MNFIDKVTDRISKDLSEKIDDTLTEGLRRKGHEFANKLELASFVVDRCRIENRSDIKEKTYFVDNIPFLLHKYEYKTHISEGGRTITATCGGYHFL